MFSESAYKNSQQCKQACPTKNHQWETRCALDERTIKRLIRKRQCRYNTAKNYNTSENWKKCRKARDLVKQTMTEAHDKYIRVILNDDSANEEQKKPSMRKKFWQYIKSRKNDTVNISTLKNSSGTEVIDSKGKVAIYIFVLNEQYDSVFTDEKYEYNAISWKQQHRRHRIDRKTKSNRKWCNQTTQKAGHIKSHRTRHDTN
ncbi:unnamed protein product [Mytilus edulis]|uniref:Uncharacterized protein n=1 Tax=Mytilus edulis TaxID=6550 RepID=A0A8S3TKS7_MYTED|nr:unnamed protein product [Mytilus edulis]